VPRPRYAVLRPGKNSTGTPPLASCSHSARSGGGSLSRPPLAVPSRFLPSFRSRIRSDTFPGTKPFRLSSVKTFSPRKIVCTAYVRSSSRSYTVTATAFSSSSDCRFGAVSCRAFRCYDLPWYRLPTNLPAPCSRLPFRLSTSKPTPPTGCTRFISPFKPGIPQPCRTPKSSSQIVNGFKRGIFPSWLLPERFSRSRFVGSRLPSASTPPIQTLRSPRRAEKCTIQANLLNSQCVVTGDGAVGKVSKTAATLIGDAAN